MEEKESQWNQCDPFNVQLIGCENAAVDCCLRHLTWQVLLSFQGCTAPV